MPADEGHAARARDLPPRSRLFRNVAGNYAGNFWTAVAALISIPLYIKFMGVAAYGLVGFYVSLQALITLLDAGLSTTLNREIARSRSESRSAAHLRDLARTLEVIYWAIALAVAIVVALLAPVFAHSWIHGGGLSPSTVQTVVILLGVGIALEFPFVLYAGGLAGLERQVELNVLVIAFATLRSFGSVLVLWLVSPTIEAFFVWQAVVSILQSASAAAMFWIYLPRHADMPRFSLSNLRGVVRFSTEIGIIGILSALLTQLPRLELSKLLSLTAFGYFSVAVVVASGLYYLVTPIFQGVFPRLTHLVAVNDAKGVSRLYHHSCQLISVVVLPVALVLACFSRTVLDAWTGDPSVGDHVGLVLALLVAGTALHALYWVPYALQLAHGWTRLTLYLDLAAVVVTVPVTLALAIPYGATGAAVSWVLLNAGCLLVQIHFTHRRLLPGEKTRWFRQDVGLPLACAALVVIPCWLLIQMGPANTPVWLRLGELSVVTVAAMAAAGLSTSLAAEWLRPRLFAKPVVARPEARAA